MSTHNIYFCGEIKTNIFFFIVKSILSRAMLLGMYLYIPNKFSENKDSFGDSKGPDLNLWMA